MTRRAWIAAAVIASCLCAWPAAAAAAITPLTLAQRFQPHLLFDSNERWRPLDVDRFLAEPGNQVCARGSAPVCAPLTTPAQLTPAAAFIDLRGTRSDGQDAAAPDLATCAKSAPTLLDCDRGGRSRIYAHVRPGGSRTAIDYWWFLRYNALERDLHEGDWEGVTVIVDARGDRVLQVHFPAHISSWRYGRRIPRLDGGRHVRVYVARGSHAAYPRACTRSPCHQTGGTLPEGRFDGRRPWAGNDAAACPRSCVRLLPEQGGVPASWDAWDGRWGIPLSLLFAPPRTPAFQPRYQDPFASTVSSRSRF
ncbi:MAG: hypothetical protein QOE11_320 [Solirubrobacteraceae bacterium]|jgi:hypothetical protein|nr:hypothetical protein [Solirubrobacteraceae bacterium]